MFARMSAQVKTVECQRIATTVGGHVYVRDVVFLGGIYVIILIIKKHQQWGTIHTTIG